MKLNPNDIQIPLTEEEKEDRLSLAHRLAADAYTSTLKESEGIYKYVDGKSIIWTQDVKNNKFFTLTTQDIARFKKMGRIDNCRGSFYIPHPLKGCGDLTAAEFAVREKVEGDVKSWIYVDDYVYAVIINNDPPVEDDHYMTQKERRNELLRKAEERKAQAVKDREAAVKKLENL